MHVVLRLRNYCCGGYTAWKAATAGAAWDWVEKTVGVGSRAGWAPAMGGGVAVGVLGAWVYITGGLLGGSVPG